MVGNDRYTRVIIILLFYSDFESEGYDRNDMKLPGTSDELVAAIIEANKNTIGKFSDDAFTDAHAHKLNAVVVQSGTPVEMPWAAKAPTILQAFYGGNAVGYGPADVIFGKVNPSSRLPLTFPICLEDNPSYLSFGGENGKGMCLDDSRCLMCVEPRVIVYYGKT